MDILPVPASFEDDPAARPYELLSRLRESDERRRPLLPGVRRRPEAARQPDRHGAARAARGPNPPEPGHSLADLVAQLLESATSPDHWEVLRPDPAVSGDPAA